MTAFNAGALIALAVAVVLFSFLARRGALRAGTPSRYDGLARAATAASAVLLLALAATGFARSPLTGWLLLAHMTAGGALLLLLPAVVLLQGESHTAENGASPMRRIAFWGFLCTGLIASVAALLLLTPLFGTDGMEEALAAHRWAGLATAVCGIGVAASGLTPRDERSMRHTNKER